MRQYVVVAVIGFFAGVLGATTALNIVPPRPDPFTGSMGRAMREELLVRIEHLRQRVEELETR